MDTYMAPWKPSMPQRKRSVPSLIPLPRREQREPPRRLPLSLTQYGADPIPLINGLKFMMIYLGNLPPQSLTKTNTYWHGLSLEHTRMPKLNFTQFTTPYLKPQLSTFVAHRRSNNSPAFECTLAPGLKPKIRGSKVKAVQVR